MIQALTIAVMNAPTKLVYVSSPGKREATSVPKNWALKRNRNPLFHNRHHVQHSGDNGERSGKRQSIEHRTSSPFPHRTLLGSVAFPDKLAGLFSSPIAAYKYTKAYD